ncbi:DUF4301 family protein [Algibacter sp. Ld11]|uniref:DUF4301 family protein n=1 Tax=Algibacter sp. Ld11 TaxID=649150 RepID=UPI00386B3091
MFSEQDILQIKNKGITEKQVEGQVSRIKNGMSYSNLIAAANIGSGIESYTPDKSREYIALFEARKNDLNIVKFVPASGAATRMFKFLFQFLKKYDPNRESIETYIESTNDILIETFVKGIRKFPFYDEVLKEIKSVKANVDSLSTGELCIEFVKAMLDESRLNYSFFPKGLLPFHTYQTGTITAFHEHLLESTLYASSNNKANLHFTVSEKHHKYFNTELDKIKNALEEKTNTSFNVSFSYQKEETETLALTTTNEIYRQDDGSILFRPAGHGALLENLNDLDSDVIFIKNIDNIVVFENNKKVSEYKKMLAGVLIEVQERAFKFLEELDKDEVSEAELLAIAMYVSKKMNVSLIDDFDDFSSEEKKNYLKSKLNKPIRVCGMVKNEGEPGGGPFWVKDYNGEVSLQIVEFAQIDIANDSQSKIVENATHFNPTDLVCGVKDYKGEKFNLLEYVDPEAAFITMKTQNGTDIQALELPGLWNGSMADWITVFVEVPLNTFSPVKTVNDLLKPEHQG